MLVDAISLHSFRKLRDTSVSSTSVISKAQLSPSECQCAVKATRLPLQSALVVTRVKHGNKQDQINRWHHGADACVLHWKWRFAYTTRHWAVRSLADVWHDPQDVKYMPQSCFWDLGWVPKTCGHASTMSYGRSLRTTQGNHSALCKWLVIMIPERCVFMQNYLWHTLYMCMHAGMVWQKRLWHGHTSHP